MNKRIEFKNFNDGDCLNRYDGAVDGELLTVELILSAPESKEICINGERAARLDSGDFSARLMLHSGRNDILAVDDGGYESGITLFYFPRHNEKRYRISSDDNIIFLEDLTRGNYVSIFDHPYLAVYKKAHDLYGAMVQLNLFYEYCESGMAKLSIPKKYFNLSMMTDRYKTEFTANSDWLKFAFHSRNEKARPYANAAPEEILKDEADVRREVERFAGAESYSYETTTIHYGSGTKECVKALRDIGYKSLTGYFVLRDDGNPRVSYYLDAETVKRVERRDMWHDGETDMLMIRIDRVLNEEPNEKNLAYLDSLTRDCHRYYYKHLPDFEALVLDAAKLLYERGYRSIHLPELLKY